MCQEMNKTLARLISNTSISAKPVAYIDQLRGNEEAMDLNIATLNMIDKLKSFALPDIYVAVIVHRFVGNWDYAEIAKELNLVSWQTAMNICNNGLALLKERGYR